MVKYTTDRINKEYVASSLFTADAIILRQVKQLSHDHILEIGCSNGYMTKYLKNELHATVVGVDIDYEAVQMAEEFLEKSFVGNLDNEQFLTTIDGSYDIIMIPAVLEHLLYPDCVLAHLQKLLKPGGHVIISLPNIAHYSTRLMILWGNFDYTDRGIMDETHLKLYTYKTAKQFIQKNDLHIEKFMCSTPFPGSLFFSKIPIVRTILQYILGKLFFRLFAEELIFVCTKNNDL